VPAVIFFCASVNAMLAGRQVASEMEW
jgi:hypothetical protein